MIKLVSGLPSLSKTRVDLTNAFIDELWHSLQHPPMSYLGDKFIYRQADGGNNVSLTKQQVGGLLILYRIHCSLCLEPRIRPMRAL